MLRGSSSILAISLFLCISARSTQAVELTERSVEPDSDVASEPVPELFPLNQLSTMPSSEPLRTEAVSQEAKEHWSELRSKILADYGNRISVDFKVPEGLEDRTRFWFDIYARYGSAHHVIHHSLYPWIIFKVVDGTETLAHGKGPQWLRMDTVNKFALSETKRIRLTLRKLSMMHDFTHLTPQERELYDKLVPVKGSRRKVFAEAANNVRSQLGQKDFFARGLVSSSRYLPYMEEEFKGLGLPTELTRLPFVESSFNVDARSRVGASGIWQIMPATGRAYMTVNSQIDERNSPLKATLVAGRLLHSYHHALKSWPLTITSYNHGIGNIEKAIKAARSRDLAQIIARYHRGDFMFASANFFTCFLAAMYAEKYNELIFTETPRDPLQAAETLKLSGNMGVKFLMKKSGLTAKDILKYNMDLRGVLEARGTLPRGYRLLLPPGTAARVQPARAAVAAKRVASR